jgi:hypothetical protein
MPGLWVCFLCVFELTDLMGSFVESDIFFLFSPMIGGLTWCTTVQVLLLQTRLEEELELRSVLESALSNVFGALTSFPHHLPIAVRSRIS